VRRVVNVTWTDLVSLAFICQVFSHDWIARREAWSFWEAVAGSQSVATTTVSSAKVAVMESGEVGRWAVYRRYSKGSRTLPWGTAVIAQQQVNIYFAIPFYLQSVSVHSANCVKDVYSVV
jgi:hypothetical protein